MRLRDSRAVSSTPPDPRPLLGGVHARPRAVLVVLGVLVAVIGLAVPAASAATDTGTQNGVAAINPESGPIVEPGTVVSPGSVGVCGLLFDDQASVSRVAPSTSDPECDSVLLYRGGSATQEALTPRPGSDTVGWPSNGLSTYTVKARACARSTKVQVLSPALLATVPGLQLAPDPGDPSHIFLQGNTGALHDEWAASRDSAVSPEHQLTTGVRSSILRTEPC